MIVEMLKNTNYYGIKEQGKSYGDIPSDIALRWAQRGIAKIVVEASEPETEDVEEFVGQDAVVDYSGYTVKQLFEMCKEKGIELEKDMINGKTQEEKHAYLVSKLA